jgi:hypothetical protein
MKISQNLTDEINHLLGSRQTAQVTVNHRASPWAAIIAHPLPRARLSPHNGAMENTYWLHIIESKSPAQDLPSTYTVSLAPAPHRHYEGGAMPTVHHPSWEKIAAGLSGFGVHKDVITKAKKELDANGSTTIQEVVLSDSQVEQLGFSKAA